MLLSVYIPVAIASRRGLDMYFFYSHGANATPLEETVARHLAI